MLTNLHFVEPTKVFGRRVGDQNKTVRLGLGIRAGKTAVGGISEAWISVIGFFSPDSTLNYLWQSSLRHNLTFTELRK
jgi:hypothetical protein